MVCNFFRIPILIAFLAFAGIATAAAAGAKGFFLLSFVLCLITLVAEEKNLRKKKARNQLSWPACTVACNFNRLP
jgi:uncharacterized membrane protein YtjA (UPF0391 family)